MKRPVATKLGMNLLIGGVIVAFVVLLGFFNVTKPRILVLHSAAQDSPWVQQVDRGMREALKQNRRPVSVEWNYLGLGAPAFPRSPEEASAQAHRAIEQFKPDVLIAVDDEANSLVARDYVGRDTPRILYVSVDRPPAAFGYQGAPNVSGIAERLPWDAVRDAVTDLFPGRSATMAVIGGKNQIIFGAGDGWVYSMATETEKKDDFDILKEFWRYDANPPEYRKNSAGEPIKYVEYDGPACCIAS